MNIGLYFVDLQFNWSCPLNLNFFIKQLFIVIFSIQDVPELSGTAL